MRGKPKMQTFFIGGWTRPPLFHGLKVQAHQLSLLFVHVRQIGLRVVVQPGMFGLAPVISLDRSKTGLHQPFAQELFIENHFVEVILITLAATQQADQFGELSGFLVVPDDRSKIRNRQAQNPSWAENAKPFTQHLIYFVPAKMFQHMGGINQVYSIRLGKIQMIYRYLVIHVWMVFKIDVNEAGYMFFSATKV